MTTTTTDPATQLRIAQLQGQITALQDAIGQGATRVSYDGRSVDYASINDMKMAVNYVTGILNQLLNPNYRKPTVGRAVFRNGYRYRFGGYRGL
ncbi:phage head-tail joining protein [Beijerinckia sp. L45]|uniref:phage head-tail joining protein n=1 Tax=Beijerinckia sp. L45 TaxID=1641855 RepID=UPI00131D6736|nr:hypothetical protein [Beijerinckia sp. L45]